LLGGGLDESPQAYKPIEQLIAAQQDLVDVVGKFTPRVVRMADEPGRFNNKLGLRLGRKPSLLFQYLLQPL
jgi:hypothetical protein